MIDVSIPQSWWEIEGDGVVASWLYESGDIVNEGDVIAEVMIEKSSFDLLAPASGELQIVAPVETTVSKGQIVARIK
ncbi:MAG: biotin attachment protein [Parvularcula sp.]|nr:biotin attachment protein [Parvularcula sp.]